MNQTTIMKKRAGRPRVEQRKRSVAIAVSMPYYVRVRELADRNRRTMQAQLEVLIDAGLPAVERVQ